MHILIVEDDRELCSVLKLQLSAKNIPLTVAMPEVRQSILQCPALTI